MRPTPRTLAFQLGRHWAAGTAWAGGLTFREAGESDQANLYACQLPQRAHRLAPAASITLERAAATPPSHHAQAIGLAVEARGANDEEALGLLADLHELLWPTDGAFIHHAQHFGIDVNGVVGIPGAGGGGGAGDVWLWRIVTLEPSTGPVIVPGGGASEIRTAEGEALATMTMEAVCTPHLIDWWT